MQAKYILNPILLIAIVFVSSILLRNLIGLLYFVSLIFWIFKGKSKSWDTIWVAPFIITVTVLTVQYLLNCIGAIHHSKYSYVLT